MHILLILNMKTSRGRVVIVQLLQTNSETAAVSESLDGGFLGLT